MAKTSSPKNPIDQFIDKLPLKIVTEITGNDSNAINRRRTLVSKGGEALRILKARKAVITRNERLMTRAGLVVDFLCRQGYSHRQMSIPVQTLADILGVKKKKDIEQMQALVSSHLETSFQKNSQRRGQKRTQNISSANISTTTSRSTRIKESAASIRDLCIRLGPLISNAELTASYAEKIFQTLFNLSNNLLTDDIKRNVEYYQAACLFLAVQKIEGLDDTKPKRLSKKKPMKKDTASDEDNEDDIDEEQTITKRDIINSASLREGTFNDTLKVANDYIHNADIPISMSVASSTSVSSTAISSDSNGSTSTAKVSKSTKVRAVNEKLEKWKRDTLKHACSKARKLSDDTDNTKLLHVTADAVLKQFGLSSRSRA